MKKYETPVAEMNRFVSACIMESDPSTEPGWGDVDWGESINWDNPFGE